MKAWQWFSSAGRSPQVVVGMRMKNIAHDTQLSQWTSPSLDRGGVCHNLHEWSESFHPSRTTDNARHSFPPYHPSFHFLTLTITHVHTHTHNTYTHTHNCKLTWISISWTICFMDAIFFSTVLARILCFLRQITSSKLLLMAYQYRLIQLFAII